MCTAQAAQVMSHASPLYGVAKVSEKTTGKNSALTQAAKGGHSLLFDPAGVFSPGSDMQMSGGMGREQEKADFLNMGYGKRARNAKWNAYYAQNRQFDLQRQRQTEDPRTLLAG